MEHVVYLAQCDVDATLNDNFLGATGKEQLAIIILITNVAGSDPAGLIDGFRRQFRIAIHIHIEEHIKDSVILKPGHDFRSQSGKDNDQPRRPLPERQKPEGREAESKVKRSMDGGGPDRMVESS